MASRVQVAELVATQIKNGYRDSAVKLAAAWLTSSGKKRQADYLAKDIAWSLEKNGYVLATITTALPLKPEVRKEVTQFIKDETGAKEIELNEVVNKSVMGGIKIETPSKTYDQTVLNRLNTLVRGVV